MQNTMEHSRVGIMDIGSNSIRLVIYETSPSGGYTVLKECRESARLSAIVTPEGQMPLEAVSVIVPVLRQFVEVSQVYEVSEIRAVATAAIRNAVNGEEVIRYLNEHTGLTIELLPGEMEGHYGFIGVVNRIDIKDGYIIDIGGGSTEITLFQKRKRVATVSFPFGAVNMNVRFGNHTNGKWDEKSVSELQALVLEAAREHPWISSNPGLPLVGLGGTIRAVGKMHQRKRKYSMEQIHQYTLQPEDTDYYYQQLPSLTNEQRKRIGGLSKTRSDIIVPGTIILHTMFRHMQCDHYIISGTGLRDGLFFEWDRGKDNAVLDNVLEYEIHAALSQEPLPRQRHLRQVDKLSVQLYEALGEGQGDAWNRKLLRTAALMHQVGMKVGYHEYEEHTRYLLTTRAVAGLDHRETVLVAFIAIFGSKGKIKKRRISVEYADILHPKDEERIRRLGALLQLAAAMDTSETQPVNRMTAVRKGRDFELTIHCRTEASMELNDITDAVKDLEKEWDVRVRLVVHTVSTN
ncbi:Ppx/GppA family phosphatase [Paenibacillus wulumuqiensis]|uniref:Ppx/GppA family phosphatase n=1 Tax=Paenibacillus wulumuqiensis TaxID=1567107 RepID=UPI000698ED36|nr:Ppx/GppA family phosphatase [Paenibacillus wulumuqiensis]